jgi:hypothetical protein
MEARQAFFKRCQRRVALLFRRYKKMSALRRFYAAKRPFSLIKQAKKYSPKRFFGLYEGGSTI